MIKFQKNLVGLIITATGFSLAGCNSGSTASNSSPNPSYQLVMDAGSSGTRIFAYQIQPGGALPVISSVYESSIDGGLDDYQNNPESAGPGEIQPLLNGAVNYLGATYNIPPQQIRTSVLATAGMRLVAESIQAAIYQSVTTVIVNDGLILGDVGTISGQNEGIYSWADINYLQNNFNQLKNTVGIVEVGGASTQVAFTSAESLANTNIVATQINGATYNVYSVSFLGLGQKQANIQMKALNGESANACYPDGYNSGAITGNFNFESCITNYANVTNQYGESLNALYQQPEYYNQNFIGLSSIWFALNFWNIGSQPMSLIPSINSTCTLSWNTIQSLYPNDSFVSAQCATATYVEQLVYGNLRMGSSQLTSLDQINGVTPTWTLGYLLLYLQ